MGRPSFHGQTCHRLGTPSPGFLINRNQSKGKGKSGRALPARQWYRGERLQGPGLTHRLRLPHHPTSSPSHLSAASRLPLGSEESDEPLPHHQTLLHQLRWQWAVGGACSSPTPVRRGGGHLAGRGVSEGPSETATSPGGQEGRGLKGWGGASGGRRRARLHPRPPSVLGLPGTGSFLSVCDLGHSLQPRPWGSGVLAGQGDTPVSTHAGPGGLGSVPGSPHSSSSVGHLPVLLPSTEAPPIVLNQRPPAFPHAGQHAARPLTVVSLQPPRDESLNGLLQGYRIYYRELEYEAAPVTESKTLKAPSALRAELTGESPAPHPTAGRFP